MDDPKFIYKGNIEIRKDNQVEWEQKLKKIQHITGYLSIYSDSSLPALKSIGGYLSIYSGASLKADALKSIGGYLYISTGASLKADALKSIGGDLSINLKLNIKLEERLWKNNHNQKWHLTDECSEWLLAQEGKIVYQINNVEFGKDLFDKVRKGKLNAQEVFAISNIEQRRVAYEKMDKIKMQGLPDYKVLEECKDKYNNSMRLITFSVKEYNIPFKFLHCICPSTKREYYLETQQNTCELAKSKSFGFDNIEFNEEW